MSGYNWFIYHGATNLLLLMGIDEPTPEQREQAEQVIKCVGGYVRSL